MNKLLYFLLCIAFLLPKLTVAQKPDRPKIGLALSGGAAHGLAHIGVIKYLEELGIEVDYITGTSMGSVIGGLYAMGYDAEEIEDVASTMNWELVMSNHIPLQEVSPIEKRDHERIPITMLWDESTFKLPRGFIRGQKLDLIISRVYCAAHLIDDFDQLYIPFRCVGVDLEDGSVDVFNSGYLGDAIRASMAIPSVFPPKLIDTTLYVDGGLIRNFPVQEAMDMGSDIIIGVYVGSKYEKKEDLKSMLSVLKQSASIGNLLDSENQKELADLVITPDIKDYGSFDFKDVGAFIEKGYAAAKENEDYLKKLALKLKEYEQPVRGQRLSVPSSFRLSEIRTSKLDRAFNKMIINNLKVYEGYAVNLDQIEESISLIYGTKNFSKSAYSLYKTANEGIGLSVKVDDIEPYSLGVNINRFELYNTALILSGEVRNVLGRPSNLRLNARISDNPGIEGRYYIRVPRVPRILFQISGKAEKYELPFYNRDFVDQIFENNEGRVKAEVLREFGNTSYISFGYQFDFSEIQSVVRADKISAYRNIRNKIQVGFDYNSLDTRSFPSSGTHLKSSISYTFQNDYNINSSPTAELFDFPEDPQYANLDIALENYHALKPRITLISKFKARLSTGRSLLDNYKIGGPFQEKHNTYGFMGIDDSELLFGDHVSISSRVRMEVFNKLFFSPTVQFLYGNNYLSYAFNYDNESLIFGTGTAFEYNSPLGPVSFDLGFASWRDRVTLNLGIGYRHIF